KNKRKTADTKKCHRADMNHPPGLMIPASDIIGKSGLQDKSSPQDRKTRWKSLCHWVIRHSFALALASSKSVSRLLRTPRFFYEHLGASVMARTPSPLAGHINPVEFASEMRSESEQSFRPEGGFDCDCNSAHCEYGAHPTVGLPLTFRE
ncbi:MAG: hypothetical protein QNL91_08075, partial [Candidatus Krumholzibacteria bacterium]|nr:hypothetical protein [Candidatus Krumholzibacteria bacterium]